MVIVSPIIEKDETGTLWNTAVVISNHGRVIGKHRKNHVPKLKDCDETIYYSHGELGHPVFETDFGRIGVVICYGRHHVLNWAMLGLNGAEIVFNPAACFGDPERTLWEVEARNAAIANSYFTVTVNRVGLETINSKSYGPYLGCNYATAPDGQRTPGLSPTRDGMLIVEMDLNLCRQVKDHWGFRMTQRLELYRECLARAARDDYEPQVIREV